MNKEYQAHDQGARAYEIRNPLREGRTMSGHTQEELAELLGVDVRTIRRYEAGQTPVPDDIMLQVSSLADEPLLLYWHFKQKYRLPDEILPEVQRVDAAQAVIALLHELDELEKAHVASKLLALFADGIIDPSERSDYEFITSKFAGVNRAWQTLRHARGGGTC